MEDVISISMFHQLRDVCLEVRIVGFGKEISSAINIDLSTLFFGRDHACSRV